MYTIIYNYIQLYTTIYNYIQLYTIIYNQSITNRFGHHSHNEMNSVTYICIFCPFVCDCACLSRSCLELYFLCNITFNCPKHVYNTTTDWKHCSLLAFNFHMLKNIVSVCKYIMKNWLIINMVKNRYLNVMTRCVDMMELMENIYFNMMPMCVDMMGLMKRGIYTSDEYIYIYIFTVLRST